MPTDQSGRTHKPTDDVSHRWMKPPCGSSLRSWTLRRGFESSTSQSIVEAIVQAQALKCELPFAQNPISLTNLASSTHLHPRSIDLHIHTYTSPALGTACHGWPTSPWTSWPPWPTPCNGRTSASGSQFACALIVISPFYSLLFTLSLFFSRCVCVCVCVCVSVSLVPV